MTGEHLARLPRNVFLIVAAITSIVFVAAGLTMNDFETAWNILIGVTPPETALGFVLSALGYVVVPAVIGLAVADAIVRFTRRRLLTRAEAELQIGELVKDALRKQETG